MPKVLKLISYPVTHYKGKEYTTYAYLASRPGNRWHAIWVGQDRSQFQHSQAYREWQAGLDRIPNR